MMRLDQSKKASYFLSHSNDFKLTVMHIALITLFGICGNGMIHAQSTAASLNGTVTDSSGAVVPQTHIAITNADTGVKQGTVTTATGTYSVFNISPGRYSVEAKHDGFDTSVKTGLQLQVNQTLGLDFVLTVGGETTTVDVESSISAVNSTTAELGTVITRKSVTDLPLNGRNFTQLLTLTPGASPVSVGQNSAGGGGTMGQPIGLFAYPAINGQRNRSNMFMIDGINDYAFIGTYNLPPIVDAIQEFKVQSHNDLAEFGQATGGLINIATKGGTNQLHGAAWEFLRNEVLDARNYFAAKRNPLRQNQFGVSSGGPITIPHFYNGQNKTFFFFAYEGFRESKVAQTIVQMPTAAELNGDFSAYLTKGITIYDPFSTTYDPVSGTYARTAFANNVIPASRISPVSKLYASTLFPAAGTSIAGGNLYDNTPLLQRQNSYSGRIDQNFGSKNQLFGRISYLSQPSTNTAGFPGAQLAVLLENWHVALHDTHVFSPTMILETRMGRNLGWDTATRGFANLPQDFVGSLVGAGLASTLVNNFSTGSGSLVPLISIAGYGSTSGTNYVATQLANTFEYGADLTKVLGRHSIKVGGGYATNNFNSPIAASNLSFGSYQTSNLQNAAGPLGGGTGNAFASFLLGVPTESRRRDSNERTHDGYVMGFYAQDQFKVTPTLSINYGLRYDVSRWPTYGYLGDGQGYVGTMNLSNGTYVISAAPGACSSTVGAPCIPGGTLPANVVITPHADRSLHNTDYGNIQARLGFAYQFNDKLALHGAYGRFYDEWSGVMQYSQNVGGTWPSVGLLDVTPQNQTTVNYTYADPLGVGASGISQPSATPFTRATYYYSPDLKTPYSDQWNIGIDQQIAPSTALSIAYVGSHSGRLDLGGLYNTAQYAAAGSAADVAARRRYPYITPTNYDDSTGNSNYHALQVKMNRSMRHGLAYLLSYTWSKSIDLACSGSIGVEGCNLRNPYNPRLDRSVSGFDLTHIFSASALYALPFGRGTAFYPQNRVLLGLVSDWQVNGIVKLNSGTPYTVTYNGDRANTGNTFVNADLIGQPSPSTRTPQNWLNTSSFAAPALYSFGTLGRNALRSDYQRNVDLSIFRRFPLHDSINLEFRAEAYNLSNTPVFAKPNSVINATNFGVITSTANAERQLQFALKLNY